MIKLILIVIAVIVILNFRDGLGFTSFKAPEVIEVSRQGSGIRKYEFQQLFDANRSFSSLAKQGHYTVVEGYLDSCSICKRIEAGFPAFLHILAYWWIFEGALNTYWVVGGLLCALLLRFSLLGGSGQRILRWPELIALTYVFLRGADLLVGGELFYYFSTL